MNNKKLAATDQAFSFLAVLLATALMKSMVFRYEDFGTSLSPLMQIAKSLVISPCSTASMVAYSKVLQYFSNCGSLSNLALCCNPRVHAKMEAMELVEVSPPFWCTL